MADRPGVSPLVVSEAEVDNDNEVNEIGTIMFTSNQLAGGDGSIAVVDESPVKEVHVTKVVPCAASGDSNSRKRPISLQSKKARGTWIKETIMGSINQAIENKGESKNSWKKEKLKCRRTKRKNATTVTKELLHAEKKRRC
jgi:hypothetical protein